MITDCFFCLRCFFWEHVKSLLSVADGSCKLCTIQVLYCICSKVEETSFLNILRNCYWADTCMASFGSLGLCYPLSIVVAARRNNKLSSGQLQLCKMGFVNSFTLEYDLWVPAHSFECHFLDARCMIGLTFSVDWSTHHQYDCIASDFRLAKKKVSTETCLSLARRHLPVIHVKCNITMSTLSLHAMAWQTSTCENCTHVFIKFVLALHHAYMKLDCVPIQQEGQ